ASVRTSLLGVPASVPTSFWIGARITPSSIDNACSRVGRLATRSRSFGPSSCPDSDTAVGTSLSLSFAKALNTRAAAPGSSFEKASTSGPLKTGAMHSNEVPLTARRASEFLTTRTYTPAARALERSPVSCDTVRPRYSAATADNAPAATAETSATIAFLSSRLRATCPPAPKITLEQTPRPLRRGAAPPRRASCNAMPSTQDGDPPRQHLAVRLHHHLRRLYAIKDTRS